MVSMDVAKMASEASSTATLKVSSTDDALRLRPAPLRRRLVVDVIVRVTALGGTESVDAILRVMAWRTSVVKELRGAAMTTEALTEYAVGGSGGGARGGGGDNGGGGGFGSGADGGCNGGAGGACGGGGLGGGESMTQLPSSTVAAES